MREVYTGTPFKSALVESGFRPARKMFCNQILSLKDNPEAIVRVSHKDQYRSDLDLPMEMGLYDHIVAQKLFCDLRDKYGLAIPRFKFVVGGDNQFYAVTERVHGQNLYKKNFKVDEVNEARDKLNTFYAALSQVTVDYCSSGCWHLADITQNVPGSSGNSQFVYGRRLADKEDCIWLVDLDPNVDQLEPYDDRFFSCAEGFPGLFRMVRESEIKLRCQFTQARKIIFEFKDLLLQTHARDSSLVRAISGFSREVKSVDAINNLNVLKIFYRNR